MGFEEDVDEMVKYKLGSLFDGIAGFPLAATIHGVEPVWASEIEKFPIEVTKLRFPNMKHLGDIMAIDGAEIEPVDIITFGSPCQDLSVAGKREGLVDGKRSNLFYQAVRIIREMREKTNGKYPRFAIWENVPGAFSSNGGQDFGSVLAEITESEIPMPQSGKWATAGMVRGNGRSAAWRILDAQYWGVPQRRKRIFLIADFTGQCAGEILFEQQGVSWNLAESGETGEEVTGSLGASVEGAESYGLVSKGNGEAWLTPERHMSLSIGGGQAGQGYPAAVIRMRSGCEGGGKGATTLGDQFPHIAIENHPNDSRVNTTDRHAVAYGIRTAQTSANGHGIAEDKAHTLDGAQGQAVAVETLYDMTHADEVIRAVEPGISPTLNARMGTGGNQIPIRLHKSFTPSQFGQYTEGVGTLRANGGDLGGGSENLISASYTVRRLTPTECERLQGFPDGWTDIPGASDTGRYKSLGNSVAVPCVSWVIGRVAEVLRTVEDMVKPEVGGLDWLDKLLEW